VTKVTNPHIVIYMDAKDAGGNLQHWSLELSAPLLMQRFGWTKKGSGPTGRRDPSRKKRRAGRNQRDRDFYPEVRGERHTAARSRRRATSRVKLAAAPRRSLASDEESHDAELPDQLP
jgi:Family of unknown function (DUF6152)